MQDQFNEATLLSIINRYSQLQNLFKDQNSRQTQVIILIGVTGAGKSTLFNFLSEQDFEMKQQGNKQCLNIKDNGQQFAIMNGGMKSVTKSPNYYYSQRYNTLLIDFPGFQDTDGKIDQVLTQILFYQIVKQADVKLVYVVRHPENNFTNRGNQLQDFFRQTFQGQNFQMSEICLILNCYQDKTSDEKLIEIVRNQLKQIYKYQHENICVMRKINNDTDIQNYLTPEKREFLFTQFFKSKPVTIFPQYIPYSDDISLYLSQKSSIILEELCSIIENGLNHQMETLSIEQIIKLQNSFQKINSLLQNQKSDKVNQFQDLINNLIKSAELINCQAKNIQGYQNFITIFNFFSEFSEYICGYEDIKHNGIIAEAECQSIIKIVQGKIDYLCKQKEKKEVEKQLQIEQQEKLKEQQKCQQLENDNQKAQLEIKKQQQEKQNAENLLRIQNEQNNLFQSKCELMETQVKEQKISNEQFKEKQTELIDQYKTQLEFFEKKSNQLDQEQEEENKEQQNLIETFQKQCAENKGLADKYEKTVASILENQSKLQQYLDEQQISQQQLVRIIQESNNNVEIIKQKIEKLGRGRKCFIF